MAAVASQEQQKVSSTDAFTSNLEQIKSGSQTTHKVAAEDQSTSHDVNSKLAQSLNVAEETHSNSTANASQIAQILELLSSLDLSDDSASSSIFNFPLEGSTAAVAGAISQAEDLAKKAQDKLGPLFKDLAAKHLANPSPELAKFISNGELSLPKLLKEGTALLQKSTQELRQMVQILEKESLKTTENPTNDPEEKEETAQPSTASAPLSASDAAPTQTKSDLGFGFEANDAYSYMTNVLASMSYNINAIEAKLAENSSKTADWDYQMNQAFISAAADALADAIKQKQHIDHLRHKQHGLNAILKPIMITVMVVSTVLLVLAGQPWLAVLMLGLMTMQMTGGTEKALSGLTQMYMAMGVSKNTAKLLADVTYMVIVIAIAFAGGLTAPCMGLGSAGLIMVGTTAMATSDFFSDVATLISNTFHTNEEDTQLGCMIAGLAFTLIVNVIAGFTVAGEAGESSWVELLGQRIGPAVMLGGAVADISLGAATAIIQCLLGANQMEMSDAEENVTETDAWITYLNSLSAQTMQIGDQIVEANNESIGSLGESLSGALEADAAAGAKLAELMA